MADTNYDFQIPTINGQQITVQWLVADPRRIYRLLRTLVQQRLIGDKLLTGRVDLTGTGAAVYEIAESIFADFQPSIVDPLMEYPLTTTTPGSLATVKPPKEGLKTIVSDETIAHNRIDKVMRDLTKIANTLVFQNDATTLSAIASAVTQTQAATNGDWTTSGANPFLDVMLASATIESLNQGYAADVVALTPTKFAYAVSRAAVLNFMPRETAGNIIATGNMIQIAGVTYLKTTNMPSGVLGIVADSTMLGSQAFENLGGGYQGQAGDVESKRYREDDVDGVTVQARIVKAPMVQETGAAVKLTGI